MLAMVERMKVVSIDIDFLSSTYFSFDLPVDYKLQAGEALKIYPVDIQHSQFFLSSVDILTIDKNSSPDVAIIQMPYLQFITDVLIKQNNVYLSKFASLLILCLGLKNPKIIYNKRNRPVIVDDSNKDIYIGCPDFEDIKRIILYQNLLHYNDEYINPDLKKAMDEVNELKNKQYELPTIERKMAIITAHTGLPKKEQLSMTLRSHDLLFEEVCGEVEFTTLRPVAAFAGKGNELEHWIHKKKRGRFDKYVVDVDSYSNSMGGGNIIKSTNTSLGNQYMQQFNNFNK